MSKFALHDGFAYIKRHARRLADDRESKSAGNTTATKFVPVAVALGAGLVTLHLMRRHAKIQTNGGYRSVNVPPAFDGRTSRGSQWNAESEPASQSAPSGTDTGALKADVSNGVAVPLTRLTWWKGVAKSVGKWWGEEHVANKAAALSFYTAFSLAPIVLLLMLLFGLVIDTQTLQTQLLSQATSLLGDQGGELIEGMLEQANSPKRGWSAVFGVLLAAFGATTVFAELKGSLDDLLAKQAPENTTLWQTIRARILSFGIVVTLGFLLLVTLLANAMLAAVSGVMTRYFDSEAVWIGRLIATVITFLGTFGLFYLIYRLLPERKLSKTALLIGAVASTLLFSVGRIGIGFYLGHTDALKAFGAAGSLAVVLIWVYYSALAFFIGALVGRYAEESHGTRAAGLKPAARQAPDKAAVHDRTDDKAMPA